VKPFSRIAAQFAAVLLIVAAVGRAQDPRVGLKPGFHDAGVAVHNMELVWSLPRPEGFFDPKAPAGTPNPPEVPNNQPEPPANQQPVPGSPEAAAAAAACGAVEFRQFRPGIQP
jgi:hypothetical protein